VCICEYMILIVVYDHSIESDGHTCLSDSDSEFCDFYKRSIILQPTNSLQTSIIHLHNWILAEDA
jgi:hypothetical protein